jgi:amino-acid N-acetyltransferase
MDRAEEQVAIIREVFRYAQVFQNRTFVLQLDDTISTCASFRSMIRDLALLHRNGIRIVLVAGASSRIDEVLTRYGVDTETYRGVRISSAEAIPFINMAAFDVANRIMTLLSGHGVNAVIGNWIRAKSLGVIDGVDYEDAGVVSRIRADLLQGVIEQGTVPILPCIGWSASGRSYNLSSRELAVELSIALAVDKLFFVTTGDALSTEAYRKDEDIDASSTGRVSRLTSTRPSDSWRTTSRRHLAARMM